MSAKRMKSGFSGKICRVSRLRGIVTTKASDFFVNANLGAELEDVFAKTYTKKTSFISSAQLMLVLAIFGSRCFSEIVKSVIRSVAVYVVNVTTWNVSIDIQKREAVRPVGLIINPDCDVPAAMKMAGRLPNFNPKRINLFPRKKSCLRTVVQQLAESFSRKICRIFSSHDVIPSQSG